MSQKTIVWFQQDLRLEDNPALRAAARRGVVLPVFVWSPESDGPWAPGAAGRWWLHHSLKELSNALEARGSRLLVVRGEPGQALSALARESGAESVYWNRRYEPFAVRLEARVSKTLTDAGHHAESFHGSLLFGPDDVRTAQGEPFRVFTPFWRACLALPSPLGPAAEPGRLDAPDRWPASLDMDALALLPRVDWAVGIRRAWTPGEHGALECLERFLDRPVASYDADRNRPDVGGTSRLSPHLHFGEISPRRVWHDARLRAEADSGKPARKGADEFMRQLVWREFAHHLLYHFPHTSDAPLRPEFSNFPWRTDADAPEAWRRGRTGYPLVDAGLRELWSTGWMHNRVRMVVASFLVKDLLVHWLDGARWFWDTLVDADLANNTLGWQWTAGCGADAAPFFRVFNPAMQGKKFDPEGRYVRTWVPEIGALPNRWIHTPSEAPGSVLRDAGIEIGESYPAPIVDHYFARDRALEAFATLKKK